MTYTNRRQFLSSAGALTIESELPGALTELRLLHADPAYTLAAYYFANYHVDPRNETEHGRGWTEWCLVEGARPRFAAHEQPKTPLWGFKDESDPVVFAQKIDAAADAGLHAFIFD